MNIEEFISFYSIGAYELMESYDIELDFLNFVNCCAENRLKTLLSKYEFKDTMYVYKVKNKIKDRIQELKGEGKTVNYDELQKYLNINYKSIFWYRLNSTIDIDEKSKYAEINEEGQIEGFTDIVNDFDYLEFGDTIKDILKLIEDNRYKKTKELYKKIFLMSYIENLSVPEIAKELDMNVKSCESAINQRILPILKEYYKNKI